MRKRERKKREREREREKEKKRKREKEKERTRKGEKEREREVCERACTNKTMHMIFTCRPLSLLPLLSLQTSFLCLLLSLKLGSNIDRGLHFHMRCG
jgi:hypothetical protein